MHWKRKKKVVEIASQTRKDVVALIKRNKDIYSDVDPDSLECGCGIASTILLKRLHGHGYSAAIHHSKEHAFIVIEGHILDITATQFSPFEKTEVLLVERNSFLKGEGKRSPWTNSKRTNSSSRFIKRQQMESWPKEQIFQDEHLEFI